jgi:Fur family ferric uptake transcriptional regulator
LAEHGFKQTRQRRAVLEVIDATQCGLTAAEVYEQGRERCPDLGLPTVYRTLEVFERLGLVRRIHSAGGCERFAPVKVAASHHVVCVDCGKVAEFTGCNVADLVPVATEQTGFRVEEHFLELLGKCSDCSRARGEDRRRHDER